MLLLSIVPLMALTLAAGVLYGRGIHPVVGGLREMVSRISDLAYEAVTAQKAIRSLGAQGSCLEKFQKENEDSRSLYRRLARRMGLALPFLERIS